MPMPLGHAAVGLLAYRLASLLRRRPWSWAVAGAVAVLANLPDVDILAGLVLRDNALAFHRGPTHSLLFALVLGLGTAWLWRRASGRASLDPVAAVAVVLSHLAADVLWSGIPISFFWPLEVYWATGRRGWPQISRALAASGRLDAWLIAGALVLLLLTLLWRRRGAAHPPAGAASRPGTTDPGGSQG
ncbi:MAG: metal-dependent hydrolase [Thermodesulfobacteriota bacterium]